ncbi:MAG: prepilin-type N-terminal cleavage/methylation domain-containing protein, partial [Verrucomicrobiales bacterium]
MQTTSLKFPAKGQPRQAFTLIELLVSMAVLSLLMVMVFSMVDQTQKTWNIARSRVTQFREARVAFEAVTRGLTQATLNPYWDYDYGSYKYTTTGANPTVPQGYQRQSELHFISAPSSELLGSVA